MAQTPESKIKKQITDFIDRLEKQGHQVYWERRDASGLNYEKGKPDLWMCYNGLHIEIEVKAAGGERSAMQELWARKFESLSIAYILADSVDAFKEQLEKIIF